MSDRLKFRVWDKYFERYWTGEEVKCNIQWLLYPDNENIENVVIEQCTGLKDKNGKLIFEGDLIKVPDDWEKYGMMAGEVREVYYKDGGFRLKPAQKMINIGCRGHWIEENDTYEVIGNIHEKNPEFLNADNA